MIIKKVNTFTYLGCNRERYNYIITKILTNTGIFKKHPETKT